MTFLHPFDMLYVFSEFYAFAGKTETILVHFSNIVISSIFTQLWQEYIFEGLLKSEMSSSKSAWGQLLSSRSSGYLTRVVKDSFEPFREIHFTTT